MMRIMNQRRFLRASLMAVAIGVSGYLVFLAGRKVREVVGVARAVAGSALLSAWI